MRDTDRAFNRQALEVPRRCAGNSFCVLYTEAPHTTVLGCLLQQCQMCADYQAGITKPAYPMPTTIKRVLGHGLADGLFERDNDGWIVWGLYDNPMPDGSFMIDSQL